MPVIIQIACALALLPGPSIITLTNNSVTLCDCVAIITHGTEPLGGFMANARLRQQGGAMVVTVPSDFAAVMGWSIGTVLSFEKSGDTAQVKAERRTPRGRKTVAQLLANVDRDDIKRLNESVADDLASGPKGDEVI